MNTIGYFANFEPAEEGGFVITFPDIPEAISEADDKSSALFNASEVLDLCLTERIASNEGLPSPSKLSAGVWIEPSASIQAAVLVRQTREKEGKNLADLVRALKTSWAVAQKLETPANNPTLRQLERTAAVLGKRLVVSFD
ncbi:MAG: type II toxin-antitoxin system HicB family antitoxin [Rhodocyclaceae bacterium]|nr:type II toxin-antitoxin system HicB family antitoxin [Rhodocyclaceae bacterium]